MHVTCNLDVKCRVAVLCKKLRELLRCLDGFTNVDCELLPAPSATVAPSVPDEDVFLESGFDDSVIEDLESAPPLEHATSQPSPAQTAPERGIAFTHGRTSSPCRR